MSGAMFVALLPMMILAVAGTTVLFIGAWGGSRRIVIRSAVTGLLVAAIFALRMRGGLTEPDVVPLLVLDGFSYLFTAVLCMAGAFVLIFYEGEARWAGPDVEILAGLLIFSVLGGAALVASRHFASLFLGLEILTVSLYPLIVTRRRDLYGLEAAVKYLILASLSSGFLLMGAALMYAQWGTLDLVRLAAWIAAGQWGPAAIAGAGLFFVGFGFKLAIVPFHLWTPDVYQGSSTPITAFLATVSKGAVFLLLIRIFSRVVPEPGSAWFSILFWLAVITMSAGNLLALFQEDVKRLLAYSSIAHVGYLLMAPLALNGGGGGAGAFYVVAYTLATLSAFGVVALVVEREGLMLTHIEGFRGLASRKPLAAMVLATAMFSLGGIPLTAGFMGKFFLFGAAIREGLFGLVIIAVVNSGISIYYYLRVVVAVFMRPANEAAQIPDDSRPERPLPMSGTLALILLFLLLILFGVYPTPVFRAIMSVVAALT